MSSKDPFGFDISAAKDKKRKKKRKKGGRVRPDSKFTGRKRKDKF